MKVGRLSVFGLAAAITLAFIFFTLIQQQFPQQGFLQYPANVTLISVQEAVGQEASATLWTQRQLDLIALAFVLFATATCCRAMLKEERKKD